MSSIVKAATDKAKNLDVVKDVAAIAKDPSIGTVKSAGTGQATAQIKRYAIIGGAVVLIGYGGYRVVKKGVSSLNPFSKAGDALDEFGDVIGGIGRNTTKFIDKKTRKARKAVDNVRKSGRKAAKVTRTAGRKAAKATRRTGRKAAKATRRTGRKAAKVTRRTGRKAGRRAKKASRKVKKFFGG